MRILLKTILDCPPDVAWRALASPAVFREVSSPLMRMTSEEPNGFPETWEPGDHPISMHLFGLLPLGEQVIGLSTETERADGVRIVHDHGRGVSGAVASITFWHHQMAVVADPAGTGKTLYRDELSFEAGRGTLFMWPVFWAFWQWRLLRLKTLAPSWKVNLGPDPSAAGGATLSK